MKFTVQYDRYFEELGFVDADTEEFESLNEALKFFNEHKEDRAQLWQGTIGSDNFTRLH